jgi:hypothetical protein
MQRNFQPMIEQVMGWQESQISDGFAKLVIYRAFVEEELGAPNTSPEKSTNSISTQLYTTSRRERMELTK